MRRLDVLVDVIAASGRVIGAHERIYELFADGSSPPLTSPRAERALEERSEAHADWRAAYARMLMLTPDAVALLESANEFRRRRAEATRWVRAYQEAGQDFDFHSVDEFQAQNWRDMRHARYALVANAREVADEDSRLLRMPRRRRRRLERGDERNAPQLDAGESA